MKISYRNYPALKNISNGNLGVFSIFDVDKPYFDIEEHRKELKLMFSANLDAYKNINVISKPFLEAADKAAPKLFELYGDIVRGNKSDLEIKGTFIKDNFVHMINYVVWKDLEGFYCSYIKTTREGAPIFYYIESPKELNFFTPYGSEKGFNKYWVSNMHKESILSDLDQIKIMVSSEMVQLIILSMFKSYAQVETKLLPPNSKTKINQQKYTNDTGLSITYLDSKWFTTLVKSDGFKVRGHFRLQPKKENGEWTKELIWIDEFQKTGYTAPARKLKQEDNI